MNKAAETIEQLIAELTTATATSKSLGYEGVSIQLSNTLALDVIAKLQNNSTTVGSNPMNEAFTNTTPAPASTNVQLIYLTNGCAENVGNLNDLIKLGLPFFDDKKNKEWHSLTLDEMLYATDNAVNIAGYDSFVLTGYSVLHENKKWLSLQIEIHFEDKESRQSALQTHNELLGKTKLIAQNCNFKVVSHDEPAAEWDEGDGYFEIKLLVPMSYAQEKAKTTDEWLSHIEQLFS